MVKKDCKTGIDLVKDERDDFLAVSHIVLNIWQNCVHHLFNLLAPELFFLILAHLYKKCE